MRIPSRLFLPLVLAALVSTAPACGTDKPQAVSPATDDASTATKRLPVSKLDARPKAVPPKAKAVMTAKMGALQLRKDVHTAVLQHAGTDGAASSLGWCVDSKVVSEIRNLNGAVVGRSSLRLRNSDNVGPDWVQAWLESAGESKDTHVGSETEVVSENGVETARFLKRLRVEKGCLACHGTPDDIDEATTKALAAKYPDDKAVGYVEGDLRGVVWAEKTVASVEAAAPTQAAPTTKETPESAPSAGDPPSAPAPTTEASPAAPGEQ